MKDSEVARLFHEAYERLAPQMGYRTREASAVPWDEVPQANRDLMIATVHEVRAALAAGPDDIGRFQRGWCEGAAWQRCRIRDLIEAAKTSDYFQQQLDALLADDPGEAEQR